MSRLPVAAFVALALATIGAFFLVQTLKVTTPLIAGLPKPHPSQINPVAGGVCDLKGHNGIVPTSFRTMNISFLLLNRPDDVNVAIVDSAGSVVDTLARNRHMAVNKRVNFSWDGHFADGAVATAGKYYVQVTLIHQRRTVRISSQGTGALEPVTVETQPMKITITKVVAGGVSSPAVFPQPGGHPVAIRFTSVGPRLPTMSVYRTDLPGRPRLVRTFKATSAHTAYWRGRITGGRDAPQGTYLMSVTGVDRACTKSRFPSSIPPAPGSTAHAGVTVRYLAAQPPAAPVTPGSRALIEVDSRRHTYSWSLRRAGSSAVLRSGRSDAVGLRVPVPAGADALYTLRLHYGSHTNTVPLVAGVGATASSGSGAAAVGPSGSGHVLVVLPSLTWQGHNPVDDDGDGIPNLLTTGGPIRLARPLVHGLPAGFDDIAGLLAYLRAERLSYSLTTDLSLIADGGAQLAHYSGVVFAGTERWLPQTTGSALNTWVTRGGRVLSLGIGALQRTVTVSGGEASDPSSAHRIDALSARPGPIAATGGSLLLVDRDRLHLFSATARAISGFPRYQTFGAVQAPARLLTSVGVSATTPAVIGYALGRGDVVDVGLPGFGAALAHNVTAQELVRQTWRLLQR